MQRDGLYSSYLEDWTKRVFVFYGKVRDNFYCGDCVRLSFAELLVKYLKEELKYDRVAVIGHKGVYFLDNDSPERFILNKNNKISERNFDVGLTPGPGGISLLKKPVSNPQINLKFQYENMHSLGELVPFMRKSIKDNSFKTAFIFEDLHLKDLSLNSEANYNFKGFLDLEMNNLDENNRGIVIFLLSSNSHEKLNEFLSKLNLKFLISDTSCDNNPNLPIFVGSPEKDEILNFINNKRLTKNFNVDWNTFNKNISGITGFLKKNNKGLSFLNRISDETVLTFNSELVKEITHQEIQKYSAYEHLQNLEGLEDIKKWVDETINFHKASRDKMNAEIKTGESNILPQRLLIKRNTFKSGHNVHIVLKGNPGTGKTTIAKFIGEIFSEEGILELGHTIKVVKDDLVGEYIGATAIKTKDLINRALGGVLFVDEAYMLNSGSDNDFGREALDTILESMSNYMGEFMVIMAGYPDEMDDVVNSNPGFERRFSKIFTIKNFSPEQLLKIFLDQFKSQRLDMEPSENLLKELPYLFKQITPQKNFGNAGEVIDKIFIPAAKKLMHELNGSKKIMEIKHLPEKYYNIITNRKKSGSLNDKLHQLIGLNSVKDTINRLIVQLKVDKKRNKVSDKQITAGHYIFVGNPGTGKTTVAQIMAKQFFELGLINENKVLSYSASELIQGYIGQTEIHVNNILEKSLGGVLFIDEAHQLGSNINGMNTGYGQNAINTIVPFMENNRENFVLILAGYPNEMNSMLRMDPGLKGRFNKIITFDDYTSKELVEIYLLMVEKDEFILQGGVPDKLKVLFDKIVTNKSESFSNARIARKVYEETKGNQALRISKIPNFEEDVVSDEELRTIIIEDIPDFSEVKESL